LVTINTDRINARFNYETHNGKLYSRLYSTIYSIATVFNCYSVNSQPVWKIMYHIMHKFQGLTL